MTGRADACNALLAALWQQKAHAADEAADRACFINYYLTELFFGIPAQKARMEMPMKQATDAKSLYDCLVAENPSTSEKRSMVSIRSVQQAMSPKQVHWIPNAPYACGWPHQDRCKNCERSLPAGCMNPWCQLRDEDAKGSKAKTSKHSGSTQKATPLTTDQCEDSTCASSIFIRGALR